MDVSIIIVNYNYAEEIQKCLDSVYKNTAGIEYEIFVVDNASSDGSCDYIRNNYKQVNLIMNENNIGFGAANNIAISKSSGKYVFLLNPDAILLNNAVKKFYDFMEADENMHVACCGGRLFDEDMNPAHSYGDFPELKDIFIKLFRSEKLQAAIHKLSGGRMKAQKDDGKKNEHDIKRVVDYVSGADIFIRKAVIDEVGYFSNDFFLYFEETELCYRMKGNGYLIYYIPDARLVHNCGTIKQSKEFNEKIERYWKRSELLFYEKCYGKFSRYIAILIYLLICIRFVIQKRDKYWLKMMKIVMEEGIVVRDKESVGHFSRPHLL